MEGKIENMECFSKVANFILKYKLISYLNTTQGKRYYFPLVKGCLPQKAPIVGNASGLDERGSGRTQRSSKILHHCKHKKSIQFLIRKRKDSALKRFLTRRRKDTDIPIYDSTIRIFYTMKKIRPPNKYLAHIQMKLQMKYVSRWKKIHLHW